MHRKDSLGKRVLSRPHPARLPHPLTSLNNASQSSPMALPSSHRVLPSDPDNPLPPRSPSVVLASPPPPPPLPPSAVSATPLGRLSFPTQKWSAWHDLQKVSLQVAHPARRGSFTLHWRQTSPRSTNSAAGPTATPAVRPTPGERPGCFVSQARRAKDVHVIERMGSRWAGAGGRRRRWWVVSGTCQKTVQGCVEVLRTR